MPKLRPRHLRTGCLDAATATSCSLGLEYGGQSPSCARHRQAYLTDGKTGWNAIEMPRRNTKWRFLSPSAHLIVDPASSARGIIRDTRADGAYRFHWSVIPTEESLPIGAGRTSELTRARSLAEVALRACVEDWRDQSEGLSGDG
jgi:hypothetical protein